MYLNKLKMLWVIIRPVSSHCIDDHGGCSNHGSYPVPNNLLPVVRVLDSSPFFCCKPLSSHQSQTHTPATIHGVILDLEAKQHFEFHWHCYFRHAELVGLQCVVLSCWQLRNAVAILGQVVPSVGISCLKNLSCMSSSCLDTGRKSAILG